MRIVISDTDILGHGNTIKESIKLAYDSLVDEDFCFADDLDGAYVIASANNDVVAIIESQTSSSSYSELALDIYEDLDKRVLMFAPLGGNENLFEEVSIYQENAPEVIVTSGAGDVGYEDRNNTSYGKGLEFWDNDLAQDEGADQSSYSNGIVLGKLLKIKDTLNCSWWEARYRARATADRTEPNRNNIDTITGISWCKYNGFGRINVENAIAYTGSIPNDPYRERIGNVGELALGINDNLITFIPDIITNADKYEFQRLEDNEWINCSNLKNWEYIDTLLAQYTINWNDIDNPLSDEWRNLGTYAFRYRGVFHYNEEITDYSEWSEPATIEIAMDNMNITLARVDYYSINVTVVPIDYCTDYQLFRSEHGGNDWQEVPLTSMSYLDTDTVNKNLRYRYRGYNRYNNVYSGLSNNYYIKGKPKFGKLLITIRENE